MWTMSTVPRSLSSLTVSHGPPAEPPELLACRALCVRQKAGRCDVAHSLSCLRLLGEGERDARPRGGEDTDVSVFHVLPQPSAPNPW